MTSATARPTILHALHRELGARMAPFAGFELPLHYPLGILKEHLHTRAAAGLFDVSHMGQLRVEAASVEHAAAALESLIPADLRGLRAHQQRYTCLTDTHGGILDDLLVTHGGDHFFLVVNAACRAADLTYLRARLGQGVALVALDDQALLALQGPAAAGVLARFCPEVDFLRWRFMSAQCLRLAGTACRVTRSGYTGEDGFEISVPNAQAEAIARELLAQPEVRPIGLGARDTLRLEAGLRLYGQDMDTTTTPVEAGLAWTIAAARRAGGAREGGFPGAARIFEQLAQGVERRLVGLHSSEKTPARSGAQLTDAGGRDVGRITSGGIAPSLSRPIALGYVTSACAAPGTELRALVRGKPLPMMVTATPFVSPRYFRGDARALPAPVDAGGHCNSRKDIQ